MVKAMGQSRKLPMSMELRPHTRVWLRANQEPVDSGLAEVTPLGIVFKRWPHKYGGITFTQKGSDGTVIRVGDGKFASDRSGEEMGLIVDERWIWLDLLHTYKGLSHGNL